IGACVFSELKYSCPVRLRKFSATHQMKFVVKPPKSTGTSTGSPCHSEGVPCCIVRALIGSPARSPYEKHALNTPEKVPTSTPFFRLNSLITSCFCATDISRSLDMPALPAN